MDHPSRLVITGVTPDPEPALRLLDNHPPAGVLLLAHNIVNREQVRNLTAAVHALPGRPFTAIDHEGGVVNRLRALLGPLPGAEEYGRWQEGRIEAMAHEWGLALDDLGIDVNFAPVVDVGPAPRGSGLESRTLGCFPETVLSRAEAFIRGQERAGIACCLKHFPGLGEAEADTHLACPAVRTARGMETHLVPFRTIFHRVPMVMVSHAVYPDLDAAGLPASLSPAIAGMPASWGFGGLVVSDDLEMGALEAYGILAERAARSIAAGCHLVILSHAWEALPDVARALGGLPPGTLDACRQRLESFS